MVCFGAVIGNILLGGQSMKTIYIISQPYGTMKLYEFIVLFGVFMLVMAQIPSFHSLRYVNLISLTLCIGYSSFATAGSIHQGMHNIRSFKKLLLQTTNLFFWMFKKFQLKTYLKLNYLKIYLKFKFSFYLQKKNMTKVIYFF